LSVDLRDEADRIDGLAHALAAYFGRKVSTRLQRVEDMVGGSSRDARF
jgi:hypothetical protein